MRVWTNGCFDLLHPGHVTFLKSLESLGDLTVFLNSDESVRSLKGPTRPIMAERHRLSMIKAVVPKCCVLPVTGKSPISVWSQMTEVPDFYAKEEKDRDSDEVKWMLSRGVKILLVPRANSISTTGIIEKCRR